MAQYFREPLHTQPAGVPTLQGETIPSPTPFRIYINKSSPEVEIKVSRYSAVLNSPDILDKVVILGLDIPFKIEYGTKIWLEIFYDRNLTPVFGYINTGKKWPAKVTSVSGKSEQVEVYPDELEFIIKTDLTTKITEVEDAVKKVQEIRKKAEDEITLSKNLGFLTSEKAQTYIAAATKQFDEVTKKITEYKKEMTNFFASAPTANTRKLLRTYTLIGITTKNLDNKLDGLIVQPEVKGPATNKATQQATEDSKFKIVQCLSNDLLLADICFQNRFPARLPIPYHRAIYYYVHKDKDEEIATTK